MTAPVAGALLAAVAEPASAPTTQLGARLAFSAAMAGLVALLCWLMWRGWRARERRQGDLPEPPSAPSDLGVPLAGPYAGRYLATTSAGDWLDRIVAHGMGATASATLAAYRDGVLIAREGAEPVFIPSASLAGARLDRGIGGSVYEAGGVVVLTWRWGGRLVDSGFRASAAHGHDELVAALAPLIPTPEEAGA
jgi:hypothetical protein